MTRIAIRAAPALRRRGDPVPVGSDEVETAPSLVPVLVSAALVSAAVVALGAPLVPRIESHFQVPAETAQWSYTVTLLVGATSTPLLGRLADGHRRRPAMVAVCLIVALGCLISGLADSFSWFLAGRAMQGLAVALVAMAIATARDHVSPGRVVRVVALLSVTTALGAGVSYPVTAGLTETFGLRLPFVGATCLTVLIAWAVARRVPPMSDTSRARSLDLLGAVLLIAGSGVALLSISEGNTWGWTDPRILAMTMGAAAVLLLWAWVELRTDAPLVELRLLRRRNVLAANLIAVLMGVSLFSVPVLVSRIGQAPEVTGYGGGHSLLVIGIVMMPISVGNLIGNWLGTITTARYGPRLVLALGGVVAAAGPALLLSGRGGIGILVLAMTFSALGAGSTFGTMANMIVATVEPEETGSATSLNIVLRAVGGSLGSAGTAALLGANIDASSGYPTPHGYELALWLCISTCVIAAVVGLLVPERLSAPARRHVEVDSMPSA